MEKIILFNDSGVCFLAVNHIHYPHSLMPKKQLMGVKMVVNYQAGS